MTSQRKAIIDCLSVNESSTLTASDVLRWLDCHDKKTDRATVYRTLERLVSEGLVLRFPSSDGHSSCFQLACADPGSDCHEHLHLKCSGCGKVIHLDCEFMSELEHHIQSKHGFSMNFGNSIIYGLCDDCARLALKKKGS